MSTFRLGGLPDARAGRPLVVAIAGTAAASSASASGLSGETLDAVANFMSWFVLCVVPLAALALFWMVHVMPEKIAHKRHHPQTKAIQVLCLLSLFFGGLLWPLAWLWAYSRPTSYRLAYGTDKHEDYHLGLGARARQGQLTEHEIVHLRSELNAMRARGALSPELHCLHAELTASASTPDAPAVTAATTQPAGPGLTTPPVDGAT